ncbi:cell wall protein IFF6 [Pelomyxa schiedti]|nr:cell wall protein IFF6 [Pelomyxa schiedti]
MAAKESCTSVAWSGLVQGENESFWASQFQKAFVVGQIPPSCPPPDISAATSTSTTTTSTVSTQRQDEDDMLFFIIQKIGKGGKPEEEVSVKRKNSKTLPELEFPGLSWEKSFLLTMITQLLHYSLTVYVCYNETEETRKPFQTLSAVQRQVFASPTKVRMDAKVNTTSPAWPFLYFSVEEFGDVWQGISLSQFGEFIAVDLSVSGTVFGIPIKDLSIFRGGIGFSTMQKVFTRPIRSPPVNTNSWFGSIISKLAPPPQTPVNDKFVEIRGPGGKGLVQMALVKPYDGEPKMNCALTFICIHYQSIARDVFDWLDTATE